MPDAIGRMNERVSVLIDTETKTASGGSTTTSETVMNRFSARVQPVRADEAREAGQSQASGTIRVTMRWRPGITARHYLDWRGVQYDILGAPQPDEQRRFMSFDAVARVP